jgi:response regulator RpfG family c-di-GMP phosphodiesterase
LARRFDNLSGVKKRRLLVASDDPTTLERLAALLTGESVIVTRSGSLGEDLLAFAREAAPDALLLASSKEDVSLAAWRRLRRGAGLTRTTLVIHATPPVTGSAVIGPRDVFVAFTEPLEELKKVTVARLARRRILVADDEPLLRRMYESYLTNEGYEVVAATDGDDAIQKARDETPDLVITDVKMPRTDGYEVCRTLKEDKETRHVPVVIVSAMGGDFDVSRGFQAGANEYLTKPLDLEELRERIDSIFRGIETRGRETILVVVPDGVERSALEYGLTQQGFEAIGASDGEEGIVLARELTPSIVITDAQLPGMDPGELARRVRSQPRMRDVPIVLLSGKGARVTRDARKTLAAAAALAKPYTIDRIVMIIERILGERRVKAASELEMVLQMIASLANALEAKDAYTRGHSDKVARYSRLIAKKLGLAKDQVQEITLAAQLHDIGKIGIRDSVLLKPSSLDELEFQIMMSHPDMGADIMKPIERLKQVVPMVRHHHERWDGRGYPQKIGGSEIPLGARIIAVADTFDSCTANRPYRRGMTPERAFAILRECENTQLDREVVRAMLDLEQLLTSPFALRDLAEEEAHEHLHTDLPGGHRHDVSDGLAPDGHLHVIRRSPSGRHPPPGTP